MHLRIENQGPAEDLSLSENPGRSIDVFGLAGGLLSLPLVDLLDQPWDRSCGLLAEFGLIFLLAQLEQGLQIGHECCVVAQLIDFVAVDKALHPNNTNLLLMQNSKSHKWFTDLAYTALSPFAGHHRAMPNALCGFIVAFRPQIHIGFSRLISKWRTLML